MKREAHVTSIVTEAAQVLRPGFSLMKVYKLFPISGDPESWKQSTFQGTLIVRASGEVSARICAHVEKTDIDLARVLVDEDSPWLNSSTVGCVEISPDGFNMHGPSEILEELG
jgi:hypothetical protein